MMTWKKTSKETALSKSIFYWPFLAVFGIFWQNLVLPKNAHYFFRLFDISFVPSRRIAINPSEGWAHSDLTIE